MPTQEITAVTVLSRNLLPYAATLAHSLARTNPSIRLKAYLLDDFPKGFQHSSSVKKALDGEIDSFDTLKISDLAVPNWDRLRFQYTPLELACAMKPFAIQHALQNYSSRVMYCDSDLFFFEPLDNTTQLLNQCCILLTPHLSSWKPESSAEPHDKFLNINQGGIFNAGFLAVRQSKPTEEFLTWWQQRCDRHCYIDLTRGVFVDQKWLDFAPSLFDEVYIDRRPSMNVGHWNLIDRRLRRSPSGHWIVGKNDERLAFFHFSGFDPEKPQKLTRHDALLNFDISPFFPLLQQYADRVKNYEPEKYKSLGYDFAELPDTTPIKPSWREAVRADFVPQHVLAGLWDPHMTDVVRVTLQSLEQKAEDQRLHWQVERLQNLVRLREQPTGVGNTAERLSISQKLIREFRRLSEKGRREFFRRRGR